MKIVRAHRDSQAGGMLLATVIATFVVGTVLLGYIGLVASANRDSVRSETWNAALTVAEAGLEEALAHLQQNFPTNILSQGWQLDGTNIARARMLGDTYYTVHASISLQPIIVSTGYVRLPGQKDFLARAIRIGTIHTGLVSHAFATKLNIKLNGNNIAADSYDSTDPSLSGPGGRYDPTKSRDRGDISSNLGTDWAFDAGNAKIRGRVATGPDGTVALGPGTVIGSTTWHDGGNVGAETGWIDDDSNVSMPSVPPPDMYGSFTPGSVTIGGTNYAYVLGDGKYVLENLSGKLLVTGDATLLITRQLSITGLDFIRILPGGSLTMYVAARTANIGGLGVVNESGQPGNFLYLGLPSNTSLAVSGNGDFAGVFYAPDTDLALNGGGNFYGAVVSQSATMNGDFSFHFDESLSRTLDLKHIQVISWEEL